MDKDLTEFINQIACYQGLTKKTSERLILDLINDQQRLNHFANTITSIGATFSICAQCFGLTKYNQCITCDNRERDQKIICVVATLSDFLNIEKYGHFKGVYAVLHGEIKLSRNIGPDQLKIGPFLQRAPLAQEVILALNNTFEGEVTANYLAQQLASIPQLKVSRLAKGLPMGGMLDYVDENTLFNALENRKKVEN